MKRKQVVKALVITGGILVGRALIKATFRLLFPTNNKRELVQLQLAPQFGDQVTYVNDAEFDENAVDSRQVLPLPVTLVPEAFESIIMDEEFNYGAHQLFCGLFGNHSKVLNAWQSRRKLRNVDNGLWLFVNGEKRRRVYYELRVRNPMAPDYANTTEQQIIIQKEHQKFVVEIAAYTPNVPFGTTFHSVVRLSGWQLDNNRCRVQGSVRVHFTSSNWLQGTIRKSTVNGVKEAYSVLTSVLREGVGVPIPTYEPEKVPIQYTLVLDRQVVLLFLSVLLGCVCAWAMYFRYVSMGYKLQFPKVLSAYAGDL
eukprot:TRINITY_DN6175_c1_g1_i1.p3 TRINITY_DN6175_c1_g1~~TRINITY_DN6175_c1_g1_i1.p3  ORF type:complete len:311 (-),score=36.00 TRINITY_DN6175_c1_g1_i1:294-1226(-)